MSADKTNSINKPRSDYELNQLYPQSIQALASKHWTPLLVAKKAAEFLAAEKNVRILDIGSGVGKFCLGAACHRPYATYVGVEQRQELISHAEATRQLLQLENVSFIQGNFTQVDFFAVVGVPAMKLKKSSYSGSRRWVLAPTAEACTSKLHLFNSTLHNIY